MLRCIIHTTGEYMEKTDRNISNKKRRKGKLSYLPIKSHSPRWTRHKNYQKPTRREGKRIIGDKSLGVFDDKDK